MADRTYRVYVISNRINGKEYVGCTCRSVAERWKSHCVGDLFASQLLYKDIQKYGKESFAVETIFTGFRNAARAFERRTIAKLRSFAEGYNRSRGGEVSGLVGRRTVGFTGRRHTTEAKATIAQNTSKALKGRHLREEWRRNVSLGAKKRFLTSPGTFTGRKHSEEAKEKIRRCQTGRKQSAETRMKRSLALRGLKRSLETRAKMSASFRGRKHSMASRAKMSLSHRLRRAKQNG